MDSGLLDDLGNPQHLVERRDFVDRDVGHGDLEEVRQQGRGGRGLARRVLQLPLGHDHRLPVVNGAHRVANADETDDR
jgi:hypothetical protein